MIIRKLLGLALLSGILTTSLTSGARAWDNCGVGNHRAAWGQCVSNYAVGPGMRGCPAGYHWGNYTHACFPNR
jgi:hypothetical protein